MPQMAVCDIVDIFIKSYACVPSLSQHSFVNGFVDAKAFQCGTDSHKFFAALGLCAVNQLGVMFVVALNFCHTSEVA